jgi:tRNA pseudouridine55 synthase
MNGITVVDKPAGWTSHDVVAKLRGVFKIKRIGHGGTLDPMATGVLPIFIGLATRAAEFCENAEKEYIAGLRLGIVTDTQDITGNTLHTYGTNVSAHELADILPRFLGAQKQIPPMYSAIKQGGKKLYELARRGIDVPRPARDIYISEIELLDDTHAPTSKEAGDFLLRIVCSKGTYVRTICHDIGAMLGCGGTLSSLRRTRAGAFDIGMAHTLEAIIDAAASGTDSVVLPIDTIFSEYPAVTLSVAEARKCRNGAACHLKDIANGRYRFYGPDSEFLLLGEIVNCEIKVIKGFFVNS